ncbi:MAG: DUF4351 domain-containing protein [Cyanobacteria bacterium J06554_3]
MFDPVCKFLEATLRQVANKLGAIPIARTKSNLVASAYILSGLVLNQALIERILMRSILEESVTYQSIIAEGRTKGIQERKKQGIKLLLRALPLKVGSIPDPTQQKIRMLSIEQMDALSERFVSFETLQDLNDWLSHNCTD